MQDYTKIQNRINPGISPIRTGINHKRDVLEQGFDKILQQKLGEKELKISHHAQMRMNTRNIHLTKQEMQKLNDAVDKADQKGVKESLVLMNDLAFVVSVKNRIVITAMDEPSIKENVFTNIDGAIVL